MHGVFNVAHFYSEAVRFVVWNHTPQTQRMPHLIQTHKCTHAVQNENKSKLLLSWCHLGMMGISCSDKLAISFTDSTPLFKAWSCGGFTPFSFTSQRCTQITETLMPFYTHTSHFFSPQPFFFTTLVFFFFFFLIALCSLPMSIFISAFTGGVREMTRLGRLAHLHGNYIASFYCLI